MKKYTPITAEPHTPPYKIHKYFARRPWNVFSQLIEIYSNPKDTILDPFMGGGVTIYEGLKLNRKVIGFDLNPLSIFIVKNMIKKSEDLTKFDQTYSEIKKYIEYLYSSYNYVDLVEKQLTLMPYKIQVEWNELAFNVFCNICGKKVSISNENKIQNGRYSCINPKCNGNKVNDGFIEPSKCKRDLYSYLYSVVIDPITSDKIKVPFTNDRLKKHDEHIKFLKNEMKNRKLEIPKDKIPLNWDRQLEDLLEKKNIVYFQDLFTEKNFYINLLLKNYIDKFVTEKSYHEMFRLIFSSSLRDTNLMSFTNEAWQSGSPTTWSKHAYWIPSQFCEVSILSGFERAYKRLRASLLYNSTLSYSYDFARDLNNINDKNNVYLSTISVADSEIKDNSIDAIITDPPYGSNVQYLELSHFWYVWNKDLYDTPDVDFSKEAISNRKKGFNGAKTMYDYENNLSTVFSKCYSALKPGKYMALTFNNKDISAWIAIVISIFKAGFVFDSLTFQDGIKNYKQTAHTKSEGSPFGDYIYVFKKENRPKKTHYKYKDETEFKKKLDIVLKTHIKSYKKGENVRNVVINDMFLEAMPLLEDFVNSNLGEHTLYSYFNKNYLDHIYA